LILKKIIKIVATRWQILRLRCTKSFVGWGSAQTPLGELTALPQRPPSWILGGLLLREGKGGEGKGGKGGERRGGEGKGREPPALLSHPPATKF